MKKLALVVMVTLVLSSFAAYAFAATPSSISDVVAKPVKDLLVSITGTVQSGGDNEYVVSDGAKSIRVEAGPSWYKSVVLSIGEKITVEGEVDTGKDGTKPPEVDAMKITRDDGSEVTVRTGSGKPPWAGGPKWAGKPGGPGGAGEDYSSDDAGRPEGAGRPGGTGGTGEDNSGD